MPERRVASENDAYRVDAAAGDYHKDSALCSGDMVQEGTAGPVEDCEDWVVDLGRKGRIASTGHGIHLLDSS